MKIEVYRPPDHDNPRFVRVATTRKAMEFTSTERYHTFGDFTVTIDAGNAVAFQKHNLIRVDDTYWGVILGVSFSMAGNSNNVTVTGLDLKGFMASRCTIPPEYTGYEGTAGYDAVTGSTETCMKHFVSSNFFPANSPTRHISWLVVAPDQGRGLDSDKYMSRYELLSNVLQKLGEASGLGYVVTPDLANDVLVFDICQGVDRSADQSDRPRVIFSPERRSVSAMQYTNNDMDMRNVFFATMGGAEFADEAYTAVYTRDGEGLPAGIHRWEHALSISADTPIAGEEYMELQRLALIEAEGYKTAETFSCEIAGSAQGRYEYRTDYNLGDIVTIRNELWGVSMNARLVAMTTTATGEGVSYRAEFGKTPLTISDKIRRFARNAR